MGHLDGKKLLPVFLVLPLLIASTLFLGISQPMARSQEHPMDHEHGGTSMVMDGAMTPAAQVSCWQTKGKVSLITSPVFSFF